MSSSNTYLHQLASWWVAASDYTQLQRSRDAKLECSSTREVVRAAEQIWKRSSYFRTLPKLPYARRMPFWVKKWTENPESIWSFVKRSSRPWRRSTRRLNANFSIAQSNSWNHTRISPSSHQPRPLVSVLLVNRHPLDRYAYCIAHNMYY